VLFRSISLVTGKRGYIILENGQSSSFATLLGGENTLPLGFELKLNQFTVEFYDKYPERPKSYTSIVAVQEGGNLLFEKIIKVNHPLMYRGFTVFQSSYSVSEQSRTVSASGDTAVVEVRVKEVPDDVPPVATYAMVYGTRYAVPGFGDSLTVSISEIYRDFKRIKSISGETNPAVKLDVYVHDEKRWSIYAFQNYPGVNMPMNQDLDILFIMKDIIKSQEINANPSYYSVLGVVKDRGIPLMWLGSIFMVIGLCCSFYIRPRRIWVYAKNGNIVVGAATRGDQEPLKEMIKKIVVSLEHHNNTKGNSE